LKLAIDKHRKKIFIVVKNFNEKKAHKNDLDVFGSLTIP